MEATTVFLSSNHSLLPHKDQIVKRCCRPIVPRRRITVITSARQGENDDQGRQHEQEDEAAVNDEENKIVLKMRIKKPKALESGNGQGSSDHRPQPPSLLELKDDWEKKELLQQEEGVFDLMELLQGSLMKTRPSLAVGVLALLALAVPLSSSVVMVNVLKVAKGLLAGCHVCIDIHF